MGIDSTSSNSSVEKTPSKGSFSEIKKSVSKKLDTTPKKIGAIVGGTAVAGAVVATSPIWISVGLLAAAGGLVGGAVGASISGVYLTYKGTKKAAEKLADSPKFQNAMGALSVSKLIKKVVLNPIDKIATRAAFRKPIQDLNKEGRNTFKTSGKAETKLHPLLQKVLEQASSNLNEEDREYLSTVTENKEDEDQYKPVLSIDNIKININKMSFSSIEKKEISKILDNIQNLDGDITGALRKFQVQHPNQTAKLVMFLKLGELRLKAKKHIANIKDAASKNSDENTKAPGSMTKEFYKACIKPIEHLYSKGKVRGDFDIDLTTLSFDDCDKIAKAAKAAKKTNYEIIE